MFHARQLLFTHTEPGFLVALSLTQLRRLVEKLQNRLRASGAVSSASSSASQASGSVPLDINGGGGNQEVWSARGGPGGSDNSDRAPGIAKGGLSSSVALGHTSMSPAVLSPLSSLPPLGTGKGKGLPPLGAKRPGHLNPL